MGRTPPYHCQYAPFTTVGQLLLVDGITSEMLNTVVTSDGQTLQQILTVSSSDTNTDAQGSPRINIATTSQTELTTAFGKLFTPNQITAIIRQRRATPFTTPADLLLVQAIPRTLVAQVFDRLTTTGARTQAGLVNINDAPAEVLAALPGMDSATAQAVVQYVAHQGPFTNVGQLLSVSQVSNTAFIACANLLTTRSHMFTIVSTGQYTEGIQETITCLVQVNNSSGTPVPYIQYWNE